MKKLLLVLGFLLCPMLASAASITVNWVLPTTASDGSPLTGGQVLTSMQLFLSTSPIDDLTAALPTATLGTVNTTTQNFTATPGQTIYARVKACNAKGCSLLSNQASKVLPLNVPGLPTGVTITLNLD